MSDLSYVADGTVLRRCVRSLAALAQVWGCAAVMLFIGHEVFGHRGAVADRLHLLAASALIFAIGLYSVVLTLRRVVPA